MPAYYMLLQDPLDIFRRAGVVPDSIRIDDGDGPFGAYPQAIRLGAPDMGLAGEVDLLSPPFQIFPRGKPRLFRAALGCPLVAAKEDVPPLRPDLQLLSRFFQ